jgi:hypothetical protein
MGRSVYPTLFAVGTGRFLAIETKAPGKSDNLTANQIIQINLIRQAKGYAVVVDDVAQLHGFFAAFDRN